MSSGSSRQLENANTLRWLRERVGQFVKHLNTRYPDDPRSLFLFEKLRRIELLSDEEAKPSGGSWKNGKFNHTSGTLFVAPRDTTDALRTQSSLSKTIVHELAHATRRKEPGEDSHSPQWKQAWLWFLQVATQELGWDVEIKCAECTFYGLCDHSHCPKCTWLQSLCKPYMGPPGEQAGGPAPAPKAAPKAAPALAGNRLAPMPPTSPRLAPTPAAFPRLAPMPPTSPRPAPMPPTSPRLAPRRW